MIVLCCHIETTFSLPDIADISQVIIAIANLFLAGYVLIYQIRKDKKIDNQTARLNEKNIKLQLFKELIVQPNMDTISVFYSNLHTIKSKINSNDHSIEEKKT